MTPADASSFAVPPRTAESLLLDAVGALDRIARGVSQLDAEIASRGAPERRRMLRHLLFTFFRRKKRIDAELAELIRRPTAPRLRFLLEAAATQVLFQRGIPPESVVNVAVDIAGHRHAGGFVNAVLRRIALKRSASFPETAEALFPAPVLERWRKRFDGETLDAFARLWLAEPEFTFRLCRGENAPAEFDAEELPAFGESRFFRASAAEVLDSELLRRGGVYIQDPATSLAPSLVSEPGKIRSALDLCAAPGGKALILAETLTAPGMRLVAADPSEKRQKLTRENFALRRHPVEIVTGDPASIGGAFDLVLADVPCTNTGVFRHRPDALWRFGADALRRTVARQREILREAARLTAPGGTLIYSTCSIEPEENEVLLAEFTGNTPEFAVEESRLLLPAAGHDGAFAARLRRR